MDKSKLGATTPQPVPGLETQRVLVMTRLFGHKVSNIYSIYFSFHTLFLFQVRGNHFICVGDRIVIVQTGDRQDRIDSTQC